HVKRANWLHWKPRNWSFLRGQKRHSVSHMDQPGDAQRARPFDPIVLGGLAAGILDISDAFIVTTINGGTPTRVQQAIASGVLGREAYQGGAPVAALGL